jgi:iron complex outermembrane receptor protein
MDNFSFNYMYRVLFLSLIIISNYYLNAQEDTTKRDSLVKMNVLAEVEVKAMFSNLSTRRFPATVYSLSNRGNDIVPVNMNESLNQIPSVYAHSGTFNTSRITMRGIGTRSLYGTRKINALLNDIPLTSGEGDTFIDDIDLQFIDRIEVVGGPTAGIYGPALGGSLLFYTKPRDNQTSVYINSGAGSYGTFQNSVASSISNKRSTFSLIYKNVISDGYRRNNEYQRNSGLFTYNYSGGKSSWNFLALYSDVRAGIPSSIDSLTFKTDPRAAAFTWAKTNGREDAKRFLTGLTHQYQITSSFSSVVTVYFLYKNSWEVRPFNYLHEADHSGGTKIHFRKSFKRVPGLTINPGFSLFLENYQPSLYENTGGVGEKGAKIAENNEDIFQANAFLVTEYAPDTKNLISLSLNVNKFGITDKDVFNSATAQKYHHPFNFSPRLSLSRQIVPNHFLFGSISHGLSYPAVQEILYPDGSINNDVNPERAWSFEAGVKGVRLLKELKYSLAFYYMPVKDLIVPDRIAEDTYVGKNLGKSIHRGVELSVEKSLPVTETSSWFSLADYRLSFIRQSNKFEVFNVDGISLKGNELPGVPETRLFLMLNLRMKFLFVEPEVYLNGRMAMNDQNSRYYPATTVANLRFGVNFQRLKWNVRLSCAVNNVFDEKYASMILINAPASNNQLPRYYYPGLPVNFYSALSLSFVL